MFSAPASGIHAFGTLTRTLTSQLMRPAVFGTFGLGAGGIIPTAWVEHGPPLCIFRFSTGMPCPGCGLTRSVVSLMHGDLSTSFYYHPLGLIFVALVVTLVLLDAAFWAKARWGDGISRSPSWLLDRLAATPAPWVAVGALIVTWLVRLPFYVVGAWVY